MPKIQLLNNVIIDCFRHRRIIFIIKKSKIINLFTSSAQEERLVA